MARLIGVLAGFKPFLFVRLKTVGNAKLSRVSYCSILHVKGGGGGIGARVGMEDDLSKA